MPVDGSSITRDEYRTWNGSTVTGPDATFAGRVRTAMRNSPRYLERAAACVATLVVLALAMLSCSSGPAPTTTSKSPSGTTASGAPVTVTLAAQNLAFDTKTIVVPPGASVTINFTNKDSGIMHNFSLYTDSTAKTTLFTGKFVTGPGTATYTFTAPTKVGEYFFRCDVHPTTMTGTFVVE